MPEFARPRRAARCCGADGSPSLLLCALLLAACSPTWDWRDMPVDGTALRVALPCRPDVHARDLALAGRTVRWTLRSCQHEGLTFGLAWADLGDPALVARALGELSDGTAQRLQAAVQAQSSASVPGSTPQAGARWMSLQARLPEGRVVQQQLSVFAHGTQVFQATVLGAQLPPAQVQPLFSSLRLQAPTADGVGR